MGYSLLDACFFLPSEHGETAACDAPINPQHGKLIGHSSFSREYGENEKFDFILTWRAADQQQV